MYSEVDVEKADKEQDASPSNHTPEAELLNQHSCNEGQIRTVATDTCNQITFLCGITQFGLEYFTDDGISEIGACEDNQQTDACEGRPSSTQPLLWSSLKGKESHNRHLDTIKSFDIVSYIHVLIIQSNLFLLNCQKITN